MKKWLKQVLIIQFMIFISCWMVSAQEINVTGNVRSSEDGGPLPGVSVVVKGTTTGTATNDEGLFSLSNVSSDATLVFSFVGMKTQEIPIEDRTTFAVVMEEDVLGIEEVVAVGYGTVRKSDLTGSVGSVNVEKMDNQVLTTAAEGMKGLTAGVLVTNRSNQPGGGINIRIRGTSSIAAGSDPLYVVDGIPLSGGLTGINPSDIKSIEVLKDASAQAIYGSRGSGGVILVTTKSGAIGKSKVVVESYLGYSELNWDMDLINLDQSVELLNTAAVASGLEPFWTESEASQLQEYDWIDMATQKGVVQNYNLTFSGGNNKTRFLVSANYFDQEGVVITSEYNRASFRVNLDTDISDKLNLVTNLNLSGTDRVSIGEGGESSGIMWAVFGWPFAPPYDENGEYTDFTTVIPNYATAQSHPTQGLLERDIENVSTLVMGNVALNYQLTPSLSYRFILGIDNSFGKYSSYRTNNSSPGATGSLSLTRSSSEFYTNQNILTFDKSFGEHTITATGVAELTTYKYEAVNNSATDFFTDELSYNYINIAESPNPPGQSASDYSIASFMGRVNYGFKDKYLLTASIRADGSSKFGARNKWGYFPSAAFAWRLIEEDFIQDLGIFSNMKLRLGWGQVGNQSFGSYNSLIKFGSLATTLGDGPAKGAKPLNLPNENLKWETTVSSNAGLDIGFLNNRLTLSTDFYVKNTDDLLAFVPVAQSTGFSSVISNIGQIQNKGIEFDLSAVISEGDFKWNVAGNISFNKNEVIELAGGSDLFGPNLSKPMGQMHIVSEGLPFPSYWAHEEEDLLSEEGKVVIKDVNGDGIINDEDRTIQGSPNPDFFYGLTSDFSFKNFDLSILLQGVYGNEIINGQLSQLMREPFTRGHRPKEMYENRWTPENPDRNAAWPRMDDLTGYLVDVGTDRLIMDGSYLRVKNVRLTYNIPTKSIDWLSAASVFVSADNLVTATNYKWFDPEISSVENPGGSVAQRMAQGVDNGSYPNSIKLIGGLRVEF